MKNCVNLLILSYQKYKLNHISLISSYGEFVYLTESKFIIVFNFNNGSRFVKSHFYNFPQIDIIILQ